MSAPKIALIAYLLTVASTALAGAMSSGSGGLLRDSTNPWFLANTTVVHACIEHDPAAFELPPEGLARTQELIAKAWAYWQTEFKQHPSPYGSALQLATQTLVFEPCDEGIDLRFQLGRLSQAQTTAVGSTGIDLRRLISVAIRTDYDAITLHGRGFIYLAADRGPLRPSPHDMVQHAWASDNGRLLYRVVVHELGHIFGLPHVGPDSSRDDELMNASYPALVLSPVQSDTGPWGEELPSFFGVTEPRRGVIQQRGIVGNFGKDYGDFLGTKHQLLGLLQGRTDQRILLSAYVSSQASEKIYLGAVTLLGRKHYLREDPLVRLWLPPAQTVLPELCAADETRACGGGFAVMLDPGRVRSWSQPGLYISEDGQTRRQVVVAAAPYEEFVQLNGVLPDSTWLDLTPSALPSP